MSGYEKVGRSRAALILLAAVASGCVATAPKTPMSMPAAYSGRSNAGSATAYAVTQQWWTVFRSDELDRLESAALDDNLGLQGAKARIVQARAAAVIAGAARYPAVNLQASRDSRNTGPYASDSALAVVASYEIDFWGRNAARASAAKYREEASEYDAQTIAITLCASVANTYFDVVGLRQRLALAKKLSADARGLLRLVEIQAEIGTGAELQIDLQRNEVAIFDESTAAIEQQLEQQLHQLAILVGRPPEDFDVATTDAMPADLPAIDLHLPVALLSRRPDVAASEALVRAAHVDQRISRAALLPNISLAAALGVAIAPTHALHVIGASLTQPLFQGGALRGQIRYDDARAAELEANFRQTVLTALQEVEDQVTAQARIAEAEQSANIAVSSARRAAFLSEAQFKLGVSDYLSVLTAERSQFQAEDMRLQLRVARQQANVNLMRALGGGFEASAAP